MTGSGSRTLVRWLKFNLVGGIGVLVQFAVLFVTKSVLRLDYLIATAMAVELTVLHNFLWHERFTWPDRTGKAPAIPHARDWPARLIRFNLSNGAISLAGNLALMKILVGGGHLNYMFANAIAIIVCSLLNFLVSEHWVFQSQR